MAYDALPTDCPRLTIEALIDDARRENPHELLMSLVECLISKHLPNPLGCSPNPISALKLFRLFKV
jgi:hypothetical protein